MGFWHNVLRDIMEGKGSDPPPCVRALAFDRSVKLTKWEDGAAWVRWEADPQFCNGSGAIFGGYICAVADIVADFTMMTIHRDDQVHATTDLRMSFFRPLMPGPIDVSGRLITKNRTSAHVEVEFKDAGGKLCAKASLVEAFLQFPPPQTT